MAQTSVPLIRRIFETARNLPGHMGKTPNISIRNKLVELLDTVHPQHVGIMPPPGTNSPSISISETNSSDFVDCSIFENVTYLRIHCDMKFSMGVFILPPGATIPLHDHPGSSFSY